MVECGFSVLSPKVSASWTERVSAQIIDGRGGFPYLSTHRQPIICPLNDTAVMSFESTNFNRSVLIPFMTGPPPSTRTEQKT